MGVSFGMRRLSEDEPTTVHEAVEEADGHEHEHEEESKVVHIDIAVTVMLFSLVVFQMILFYLTNHYDEDFKLYSWQVISTTISIFCAILVFHGVYGIVEDLVLEPIDEQEGLTPPTKEFLHFAIDSFIFLGWFVFLHATICMLARSHHQIDQTKTTEQIQKEHETKMKAYAMLFAHTTAFAGIHCTWRAQHWIYEGQHGGGPGHVLHHLLIFLPIVGFLAVCFGLFRLSEYVRNHLVGGADAATATWDAEAEEAENDIAVLALSFLIVQALRYWISGVFPNAYGVEEETEPVPAFKYLLLYGFSMVFAAVTIGMILLMAQAKKAQGEGGETLDYADFQHQAQAGMDEFGDYVERWKCTSHQTTALCVVWCILYSEKWQLVGFTAQLPMKFSPNHTTMSVGLALFTSATAFILIFFLDKIQDMSANAKIAQLAIPGMIKALAVLIGFAWEQSFDAAVEVIAEISDEVHAAPASVAKFLLAAMVAIVVVPQWRAHILSKTLELQEERDEKKQQASKSEGGTAFQE
jgi:hypothetical protein